jgi:CheY-like chemotaxis protein
MLGGRRCRVNARRDTPVEVMFSDIRMPAGMNGFELAQWIGRNKPEVAVVLTSARAQREDLTAQACPDSGFVPKPYTPHTVLEQIRAPSGAAA